MTHRDGTGDSVAGFVDGFHPRRPDTVLAVNAHQLQQQHGTPVGAPAYPGDPGPATTALLEEPGNAGDVLVILDTLDEAADPAAVLDKLLLPLATGPATAGCRILLGTRPWWDAPPALRRHSAGHPDAVLTLAPSNDNDRRALADGLDAYLRRLLRPRDLDARERVRGIARRLAGYS
ncbi:hypothetical protein [Streptomyces sp. CB02400]|uniref:hypothetical protein n=1 Tax=Streptomyces sp. CB02400 TaxID=1703944 RepID=UPI00093DF2D6|nr:hypothetical protein [Streptomyces sp. CB02400]OKK03147.1 hypothetical protein AMK33_26400 [Streptomyces sp. CB02400]